MKSVPKAVTEPGHSLCTTAIFFKDPPLQRDSSCFTFCKPGQDVSGGDLSYSWYSKLTRGRRVALLHLKFANDPKRVVVVQQFARAESGISVDKLENDLAKVEARYKSYKEGGVMTVEEAYKQTVHSFPDKILSSYIYPDFSQNEEKHIPCQVGLTRCATSTTSEASDIEGNDTSNNSQVVETMPEVAQSVPLVADREAVEVETFVTAIPDDAIGIQKMGVDVTEAFTSTEPGKPVFTMTASQKSMLKAIISASKDYEQLGADGKSGGDESSGPSGSCEGKVGGLGEAVEPTPDRVIDTSSEEEEIMQIASLPKKMPAKTTAKCSQASGNSDGDEGSGASGSQEGAGEPTPYQFIDTSSEEEEGVLIVDKSRPMTRQFTEQLKEGEVVVAKEGTSGKPPLTCYLMQSPESSEDEYDLVLNEEAEKEEDEDEEEIFLQNKLKVKVKGKKTDEQLYGLTLDQLFDSVPKAQQNMAIWLFRKIKNLLDPVSRDLRQQHRQMMADLEKVQVINLATKDFAKVAAADRTVETESTRLKEICQCPWTTYESMVEVCESDARRAAAVKYVSILVSAETSTNFVTEVCDLLIDRELAALLYVSERRTGYKKRYSLGRRMHFLPHQFIPMVRSIVYDAVAATKRPLREYFSVTKITKWLENKRSRFGNRLATEYLNLGMRGDQYAEMLAKEFECKATVINKELPHPNVASEDMKKEMVQLFYEKVQAKWLFFMASRKQVTKEKLAERRHATEEEDVTPAKQKKWSMPKK